MKKIFNTVIIGAAMMLLFGCTPSKIDESTKADETFSPDSYVVASDESPAMTLPETSKYTIPADAETGENGGPGAMATTAVDYSYYPEDKQKGETSDEQGTMVIIYTPTKNGITYAFDYVDTCDAQSLIDALVRNFTLTSDCTLEGFDMAEDGKSAVITISDAKAVYAGAPAEEVVTAVANTFIDNFSLDEIDVIAGDTDYGMTGFSQEYDAK